MKIIVARHSGFCMGVRIAMNTLLKNSHESSAPIQTLGPLIHNPPTLELLRKKRVTAVGSPSDVTAGTVAIRTHGVPPSTKAALEKKRVRVIDATCPHVKRIQFIIEEYFRKDYGIVIFGDADHAEVRGLMGFAGGRGYVIASVPDISRLPAIEKVCLVAQTTQSLKAYEDIKRELLRRFPEAKVFDTVCRATANRQAEVERLARHAEAVIVVGGKNSANSTRLYEIALKGNPRVFHIETEEDLKPIDFSGIRTAAVVSGASTPSWLINRVTEYLKETSIAQRPFIIRRLYALAKMLVFTNFYLGAGAALLTWAAAILQDHSPRVLHMAAAGLYIQSMYILNHLSNIEANRYEDIFKNDFILQHRRLSMAVCLLTGLLSMALSAWLGFEEFLLVASACAAGVLYHVNLLPENNLPLLRRRRLKDITLSKDLGISIAWSAVCVLAPYEESVPDSLFDPASLTVLTFVFGLVFIRSIFHDLHDIQRDRVVGHETLPIVMGRKFVWVFPHPLLILLGAVPFAGALAGLAPPFSAVLALVPAYLYVVRFLFERNRLADPLTFGLVVDFMVMMPSALVGLTLLWG